MRDCPSGEELRDFLTSALPEGRAGVLRAHVSECDRCQEKLDRLTDSEVLDGWRTIGLTVGAGHGGDEPALSRVLRALRATPSDRATGGDGEAGGTESDAGAVDWRAVLGPPERPGDLGTLGPYLVEAELGRGGMGIVLRAYDPALERRVALKVLRPDLAHPRARRRLVREARAAARFRHDHLVAVYAVVDPPEGLPYLVMEYLAGPTLGRLIGPGSGLAPRRAAELVAQVADGLAAAHDAGLVHRDIKPENIMIDPAAGRAKLMDFGLARDEAGGDGESLTRDDVLAGTPTHMSPEQARGLPLDGRSDVYGLGVSLYQCLTGEVPFRGAPHMVIRQVCEDEPRPPRRLNDRIPRDLETIALKAMAKEPAARYPSARAMADDLRRWIRGESIRARPPGPAGRLVHWCRRNARLAAMAAAVLGLLVLLSAVSSLAAVRIAREQRRTLKERQAAREHYRLALETLNSLVLDVNQKLGNRPGTLPLKRDILETARAGLEKIARSTEAEGAVDRGAVVAHDQLGDVLLALGRTPEAARAYERSRDLAAALVKADPGAVQPRRDLARAHDKRGDLARFNGDIPAAEAAYRAAVAVRDALIRRHGHDPEVLRDMHVSSNKIGLIRLRRQQYAEALDQFRRSLDLLERFAPSYPSRTKVLADYEYTYRHLGQACLLSDWTAGVEYSRKALESARAFVAAEPEDLWLRKKLAIDLDQLAVGLLLLGDLDGAEAGAVEAHRMRRADLAAEPGDVENRRNVAVSLQMLGLLARCRRDWEAARRLYAEGLSICEAIAEADPGSAQKQADVLETADLLADTAERAERYDEARERIEKTLRRLDRLERERRLGRAVIDASRARADVLRAIYRAAARGMPRDAAPTGAPAPTDLPPGLHDSWRLLHAFGLARRGRHAEAAAIAEDVRRRHRDDVHRQLRSSRILSLCAAAVAPGRPVSGLSPDERRLQGSYIDSALDAARQALRLEPARALEVFQEPDLDLLRRRGVLEAVARELGGTKG